MIKKQLFSLICICALAFNQVTYSSISIVYNLRVAETTKLLATDLSSEYPSMAVVTPFGTYRKKLNDIKQLAEGLLGTLSYTRQYFYVRVDSAFGYVKQTEPSSSFSRTQPDDILFSGGYSKTFAERSKITLSGLLGFATHKDTSLVHIQFGYGHTGLGAQLDGSHIVNNNGYLLQVLRAAARCIHFFPANVCTSDFQVVNFNVGNLVDFFASYVWRWKANRIELGYDLSFFFNARITPYVETVIQQADYVRSNFFGSYKYRFKIGNYTNDLTAALSYGFDHLPKQLSTKRIVTIWGSWSIHF